jgi:hypothetical protein
MKRVGLASDHAQELRPHAQIVVERPPQHLAQAEQIRARTQVQEVAGRP